MKRKCNNYIRNRCMTKVILRFLKENDYIGYILWLDNIHRIFKNYMLDNNKDVYSHSLEGYVRMNATYDNPSMLIPCLVSSRYYNSSSYLHSFFSGNSFYSMMMDKWVQFCKYNHIGRYSDAVSNSLSSLNFSQIE